MNILISNDDGYQAAGINALYEALKDLGRVQVVAPELNNSAKSNALTLYAPLTERRADNGFIYLNGTPADCVHVALNGLLDFRPDLVVSGINFGANMGDDTIYSGTVGAAMEGYLMGVPAIAFSQVEKGWAHLDAAAQKARELVLLLQKKYHLGEAGIKPMPWLLNVNIPNLPVEQIKGFKTCRLGRRHHAEEVFCKTSPFGERLFWLGAAGSEKDAGEGTDFHATAQGYVAVTPLTVDLTNYAALESIQEIGNVFIK